jgi:hypothetical protein
VVWREGGVSSVFLEGRLRCRKAEGPVGGPWELVGTFMPRLWLLGLSLGWLKCVLTCGLWSGDNLRGAGPVCQAAHVHRALLPRDDFNASCALSFPCASLKPDMCLSGLITSLGLFLMWAGAVRFQLWKLTGAKCPFWGAINGLHIWYLTSDVHQQSVGLGEVQVFLLFRGEQLRKRGILADMGADLKRSPEDCRWGSMIKYCLVCVRPKVGSPAPQKKKNNKVTRCGGSHLSSQHSGGWGKRIMSSKPA